MRQRLTEKAPNRYELFVSISLIGTVSFFVYALLAGAGAFDWIILNNVPRLTFCDYFEHMRFMQDAKHVYVHAVGEWGAFPPLVYCFYNVLYHLTIRDGRTYEYWFEYENSDYTLLIFLFYTLFLTFAFLYSVKIWRKHSHYRMMVGCLLLSTPFFAGAYERGNSVMIVVVLLLIALNWRDSESMVKRELAMILIAICAGIKIYPAIFGLLYLKEKRWKETLRLVLYGIVFFFGPFVFFLGKNGFLLWLSNVLEITKTDSVGRVEYIKGVFCTIFYWITGDAHETICDSISILFLLFMIFLAFLSNSRNRTVFFLCAAMAFFPINAFRYTQCYLAIPLIIELMEHGEEKTGKSMPTLETTFFGLLFTIPTYWGVVTQFRLKFNELYPKATYVEGWCYLIAYCLLIIVVMHEIINVVKYKDVNPTFKRFVK